MFKEKIKRAWGYAGLSFGIASLAQYIYMSIWTPNDTILVLYALCYLVGFAVFGFYGIGENK